ncbi:putative gustatory receptor 28b [Xylocopa sonorina]|uniref:putative gustatory receptor 28b n=1 Tax=Xylocopa sonorina TaxID=1818115 RepID=UPI00403AC401
MNCLYSNNMYVLNGCFGHINGSLMEIRNSLINDQPHLLRRVYHMQNNPALLTKLRTLKKQHLDVSQTLQTLNDSFSMQCVAILTLLFLDITFNIYTYTLVYNKGGRIKQWLSFPSVFLLCNSLHIVMLVWSAEVTKAQVEKMGTNIHRIIVHTFDEQITDELKMFSLQVLQRDHSFVAKGLVIDATLLTKILCSVTTFLLILVQFLLRKPC